MKSLAYFRWPVVIFLLGAIVWVIATLRKITHHPHADTLFSVSAGIIIIAIVFMIIKLFKLKG